MSAMGGKRTLAVTTMYPPVPATAEARWFLKDAPGLGELTLEAYQRDRQGVKNGTEDLHVAAFSRSRAVRR